MRKVPFSSSHFAGVGTKSMVVSDLTTARPTSRSALTSLFSVRFFSDARMPACTFLDTASASSYSDLHCCTISLTPRTMPMSETRLDPPPDNAMLAMPAPTPTTPSVTLRPALILYCRYSLRLTASSASTAMPACSTFGRIWVLTSASFAPSCWPYVLTRSARPAFWADVMFTSVMATA